MKTERISKFFRLMPILLSFALAGPVYADEVIDSIKEAVDFYKDGRYTDAVGSLDYASQLIRQKRTEMLTTLLPEPLPDWTAEKATTESAGLAMLGGILSAKRIYHKGASRVTMEISDSAALHNIMAMFSNLMFTATGDGRLQTDRGHKAIIKYVPDTRGGDVTVMIENRCMLFVKGGRR